MKKYIILGAVFLGMNALSAATILAQNPEDKIKATITASTTEKELEDLVAFLQEHDMELLIKKQQRNENAEITGISLKLQRAHQQRQYSMFSNRPIPDLELGSQDGALFINAGSSDLAGMWGNALGGNQLGSSMSDMLAQFGFNMDMDFDDEANSLSFNGNTIDLGKLREQMMQAFNFEEDGFDDFFQNQNTPSVSKSGLPKYSFIDKPGIDKLIIIDGEEASFKKLDQLAKSDQLEEVDFLKTDTAISIYGEKAKDGAIIATTKK